jgi:hypothetical protein
MAEPCVQKHQTYEFSPTRHSRNQDEEFEQKLTKTTKGYGFREWFCEGLTLPMWIFLPKPATGGVLAACGLCDLCGLLFKILFPFQDKGAVKGAFKCLFSQLNSSF